MLEVDESYEEEWIYLRGLEKIGFASLTIQDVTKIFAKFVEKSYREGRRRPWKNQIEKIVKLMVRNILHQFVGKFSQVQ